MTDTKSAEQLAGEVKAAFDAQQQAVKKDFDTRHDEVKALAEEALGKVVPEADPAEVRENHPFDRVVASFESRGEAEPLRIVTDQRFSKHAASETMAFVGDQ